MSDSIITSEPNRITVTTGSLVTQYSDHPLSAAKQITLLHTQIKQLTERLASAEEAKLDAQDDARAQFGRYMDCDKAYRALQDRLAAAEAERIWTCGCGIVNGVNLATCRVCGRKEGEQC